MKYASYIFRGFVVFWIVEVLSINIAQALGPGPGEIGIVVSAISMLSAIVVICTFAIVDTIKSINNGE